MQPRPADEFGGIAPAQGRSLPARPRVIAPAPLSEWNKPNTLLHQDGVWQVTEGKLTRAFALARDCAWRSSGVAFVFPQNGETILQNSSSLKVLSALVTITNSRRLSYLRVHCIPLRALLVEGLKTFRELEFSHLTVQITARLAIGSSRARYNGGQTLSEGHVMGTGAAGASCGATGSGSSELQDLIRYRRDLHRMPELDDDLPQTIAYIESVLAPLVCEITHPCKSCVCAFFDAGSERTTAIRADMDALPITETTGCDFASEHPGCMHACGHDAHMAMALAAAVYVDRELRERSGSLPRNVLFVFQPAEETTGGAKRVCESGVFERYRADRIFGFHVWPDLPAGTVASCPGPLLARSSETHITIHGESTHIAKTYGVSDVDSHDAALAAARFLVEERKLMDRLGAEEPCICKFGQVTAGTVCNAVAGEAKIAGSLRVFSDEMFDRAKAELRDLLARACEGTGCTGEIDFAEGYPPVTNDASLYELAAAVLPELERVEEPLLIAEDFAFYQRYLPGVFFLLGVGEPTEMGAADPELAGAAANLGFARSALHTDTLMFDERILLKGLSVYRRLVHVA